MCGESALHVGLKLVLGLLVFEDVGYLAYLPMTYGMITSQLRKKYMRYSQTSARQNLEIKGERPYRI
jgi:hypothetical protein